MSFEGYYQVICKNGHYNLVDCFQYPRFEEKNKETVFEGELYKCPLCEALAAWYNLVNTTNGSYCDCNPEYLDDVEGCEYCDHGRIDGYIELEEIKECTTKFKVPSKGHKVNI